VEALIAEHGLSSKETSSAIQAEATQEGITQWADREIRSPEELDGLPEQLVIRRGGVKVAAFRALIDTGKSVETRLVDTAAEAERQSLAGIMRLFAIKNDKALRNQVKHLPKWNEAALALSAIIPSSQLQIGIQDLMARIAFVENQPTVKSSLDFDARQARSAMQISGATQEIAAWLPMLASNYQELRLRLEKAPSPWKEVIDSIRQQLGELFGPRFLQEIPWQWLKEYPRYLQASRLRLDKLTSGGLPKDRKLAEPLVAAKSSYQQAAKTPRSGDAQFSRNLNDLRWLIEELQVSLFAQQLGTKVSVSPKRIQEVIQKLL
jgi:ATP-dependent helicase HrpA